MIVNGNRQLQNEESVGRRQEAVGSAWSKVPSSSAGPLRCDHLSVMEEVVGLGVVMGAELKVCCEEAAPDRRGPKRCRATALQGVIASSQ
jgi:hypothetical protein